MCGICGYINHKNNFVRNERYNREKALIMNDALTHRGPDAGGVWVGERAVFAHRRLAVVDVEGGMQPMKRVSQGYEFIIVYNGELYNTPELKRELMGFGYEFTTTSDTEVLLYAYIHYGTDCLKKLNGIYAFAIYDSMRRCIVLARDRFGVKPLFYYELGDTIVFASEIKALFKYPGIRAELDPDGLCELLAMSPARTEGNGVFKGIKEVLPGHFMRVSNGKILQKPYWELKSCEHTDSYEDTIETVRELLVDAIKRQLVSDVPIATFLSGGLDSSFITAVAANEIPNISTYSFDYEGNDKYFKSSSFQPDPDSEWVPKMSRAFNTDHTYLVCPNDVLVPMLYDALAAKDLPGMADCDSSLVYFCREVKKRHTVVLSGECSDEIFGGYPWFRDPEAFRRQSFPWCYDLSMREDVLLDSVRRTLDIAEYSYNRYSESIAKTPYLTGENDEESRRREISWLNIKWFMTNLLDRKDRMSMASGLEVRVPFCDHRLVEYVWNIPWEMKNKNNISKNILREAAKGILPEDIRTRKKSPYPKTHNPFYEAEVKSALRDVVENPDSPILAICDRGKLYDVINGDFDYGKPFFGQLMAGPQFVGYLLQLNRLFEKYDVRFV